MIGVPKFFPGPAVLAALLAGFAPAGQALADPNAVIAMRTADEVRGWQSVGKLVLEDRGFCTGVLIAPKLVLTAAHCLFDKDTGARLRDQTITFQAGFRDGRAEAYRGVRRSVAHPDYIYSGSDNLGRVAWDLALLELDHPIQLKQIVPFETGARPARGASVSVVSYAKDRSETPSIERDCSVMATDSSALVLSCDIDFGSSGAPVFAMRDGLPEVVAVISAKADYNGQKVALAVAVDEPLAVLQGQMDGSSKDRTAGGVRVISGGTATLNSGRSMGQGSGTGQGEGPEPGAEPGGEAGANAGSNGGAKFIRP